MPAAYGRARSSSGVIAIRHVLPVLWMTSCFLSTHADRKGVDILFTVLFVFCLFVQLRISLARIKLAASNLARWFIGVLGRESPILGNFAPPKAQNRTNWCAVARIAERRQSPSNCALAVSGRDWRLSAILVLDMRGYTAVPKDGHTCFHNGCSGKYFATKDRFHLKTYPPPQTAVGVSNNHTGVRRSKVKDKN